MIARAQLTIRDENDMAVAAAPPVAPTVDTLWLDTSVSPNVLKRWNGSAWVIVNDTSALATRVSAAELRVMPDAIMSVVSASEELTQVNQRLSEAESSIEQHADAIALKTSQTDFDALATRMNTAELKLTPESIAATVRETGIYEYDAFEGRNYLIGSAKEITLVDGYTLDANGDLTVNRYVRVPLSADLFADSGNASRLYLSFDIKRSDIASGNSGNAYTGVWFDYQSTSAEGNVSTGSRGWYLRTTDTDFSAVDEDWVRIKRGYLDLSLFNCTAITGFSVGMGSSVPVTGTVTLRNLLVEAQTQVGVWSPAPEEQDSVPVRLAQAESGIRQNASEIALKVSRTDLENRLAEASLTVSPEQIISAVRSTSGLYRYEHFEGRNYVLDSGKEYVFVDGYLQDADGNPTTSQFIILYFSKDLFKNSGGDNLRLSFDIKYENVAPANSRVFSAWYYYRYTSSTGSNLTTGRGWGITGTGTLNIDWTRWKGGPLSLSAYGATDLAYLSLGLNNNFPVTGTVRVKNVKVEWGDSFTAWEVAPEDPDAVAIRLAKAESNIVQNASAILLRVSQPDFDALGTRVANAESSISVNANSISTKVNLNGVVSAINQSAEAIAIAASKLNLNGVVTANNYFRINLDGSMTCTNGTFSGTLSAARGTFAGSLSAATGTFSGSLVAGSWTFSSGGSVYTNGYYAVYMTVDGLYANFYTSNLNARYGSTSYNDTVIYGGSVKLDCASTGQSVSVRNGYWGAYSYQDVCMVCDQAGGSYAAARGNLGTTDNRWDICWVDTIHYNSRASDSSREIKHDIEALPAMGDTLDKLKPVSFKYNDDKHDWKRFGLIYEDTVEVLPDICHEIKEGESVSKGISYEDLIAVLVKEVQDLRARVAALEAKQDSLARA